MASWSTIENLLHRLTDNGITPDYQPVPSEKAVDWSAMPGEVDPTGGLMDGVRAERKRRQVENVIQVLQSLVQPGDVIVDFGASSGNLGLPVAACFPDCQVYIVDKKPRTVEIAKARIAGAGLANAALYPGFVQEVTIPFNVGLGLHLCGDGTDQAQMMCMDRGVPYVMAPCCIGFIQRSDLDFPRSTAFRNLLDRKEYNWLAGAADWTCRDETSEQHQRGKQCMGFVNTDRNMAAAEMGYQTALHTMNPSDASPKNEIIVGRMKEA